MSQASKVAPIFWHCCAVGAAIVVTAIAISSGVAAAPNPGASAAEQCLNAHHEGQELRKQLHLLESRALFNQCSDAACPGPVQRDCQRWAEEATTLLGSVVFSIDTAEANPSRDIKIFVNGELRYDSVPKRAVEFEPGTYRLRFVAANRPPVEQELIVLESEKFKRVVINFNAAQQPAQATPTATAEPAKPLVQRPKQPPTVESRPTPVATYVFAGLGAAATISFVAFGLSSKALYNDLDGRCAPGCDESEVDRARSRALLADISLGVGVASFATATLWYFLRPTQTVPVEVDVGVLPKGGVAGTIRVKSF